MHSNIYHNLSEEDLGAVIAFVKSLPPVDNEVLETKVGPLGKIIVALGMFDVGELEFVPAEVINHRASFADAPPQEASIEYGQYLLSISLCSNCHGSDFRGAPSLEPGVMPDGPNLTPRGELGGWSEADFIQTMRTGVTPDDHQLDGEFMPWSAYANLTDEELIAIWFYLSSL